MSHSNERDSNDTPPHLINFVLSILTNDLIQSEIDRVSHFFLSFRPEGLTPKDSSSDVMPILYCTAARRAARWCRLSLQILHLLTPPSNSNGCHTVLPVPLDTHTIQLISFLFLVIGDKHSICFLAVMSIIADKTLLRSTLAHKFFKIESINQPIYTSISFNPTSYILYSWMGHCNITPYYL